ncbi:MAG TPA: hypothetical protein VGJ73_17500 [Verrucomicrobiae bacterium]
MKIIRHVALLGTVTLLVTALSARASLITGTDPGFASDSLTIDTQTELAWLNLSFTADLSYNQVLAGMQPGGIFNDYTFATSQEVAGLYADAGISAAGYYSLSTPAIGSLISLVGSTTMNNGQPGFVAISGTSDGPGVQEAPSIYATGVNGTDFYFVSDGTEADSTSYGVSTSLPGVSDWLVKTVPEPSMGSIGVLGLMICAGVRRFNLRRHR